MGLRRPRPPRKYVNRARLLSGLMSTTTPLSMASLSSLTEVGPGRAVMILMDATARGWVDRAVLPPEPGTEHVRVLYSLTSTGEHYTRFLNEHLSRYPLPRRWRPVWARMF